MRKCVHMASEIEVLRIGQRLVRDDRVTTHAALLSRAFGASRIYMTEADPKIRGAIQTMNESWGGGFEVVYVEEWRRILREKKRRGHVIVHLTMYGKSVNGVQDALRRHVRDGRSMLVVIGAEKVPRDVYGISDYNVSVGVQPHSEVAALAVLLDRVYEGRQLEAEFAGAKYRIVPSVNGEKNVEFLQGGTEAENGIHTD